MFSRLKRLFRRDSGYNQFAPAQEKLRTMNVQPVSVATQQGLGAYERAQSKLDAKDEAIANRLIIASHQKDREKVKEIGRQLNESGGIEKMKLLCYRARHLGGDDRWIEMMWSGIGDWMG